APDYVLLPARQLNAFVDLAVRTVQKFYPTLKDNADYSSMINERHYGRVAQYVAEARASGARVTEIIPAGEALAPAARKLPPTLLPSCARKSSDRCCRSRPIVGSTRRSTMSTGAHGRSRSTISAPTRASATRSCARPSPGAPRSTRHCFRSRRKACRSAALA